MGGAHLAIMMTRAITAALLVCAACVDSDTDAEVPSPIEPDKPGGTDPTEPELDELDATRSIRSASPDICEPDPEAVGACALACDPQAVIDNFVPVGVCAIFECKLADGSLERVGGCR
ncbi:MAG: hypothetical protein H0T89_04850 [Deltaproteobacteria bacterium]|nr:hypothetical protein [Deltaproteobacteria bacterium]MDQ3301194.1 hypothetical protein [Myxococcota bacterium]